MSKVFIFDLDKAVPEAIGTLLSKTIVGSKKSEDEEQTESNDTNNEGNSDSVKKIPSNYQIFGTVNPSNPYPSIKTYSIPSWVAGTVSSEDEIKKQLLESDVIVCDLIQNLNQTKFAVDYLNDNRERFAEKPKTLVCISSLMTWAKTKVDSEETEASLLEEDFRKRKAHPNFKDHLEVEKNVIKVGKKAGLKTYVISSGLVYHGGMSIFHFFLKLAWQGVQELPIFGEGNNILPTIHLHDLSSIALHVIESRPEIHYIVAVDESKLSLGDIVKSISENLGSSQVSKISKDDALLFKDLSQSDYDMLLLNLRIDAGSTKDFNLEWKYETGIIENIATLINEYRDYWNLWPIKCLVHGPPNSGKSFYSQKIAKEYKLHYIQVDKIMTESVANLEKAVNRAPKDDDGSTEDEQKEAAKELLEEYRNALLKNNQEYPPEYIIRFVKERLRSMPCKNQGYVLDGFPATTEESLALFQGNVEDDDQKDNLQFDKLTIPEFIINLECTDDYIKNQVMKMAEKDIQGTPLDEKNLIPRLENYRKVNTDENTLLNYFDEREIHPLNVHVDQEGANPESIMDTIKKFIGKAHNYGPTQEEIAIQKKQDEEKQMILKQQQEEERLQKEHEEQERKAKATAEWTNRLEEIRKQEREVLEAQSVPLRQYLMKNVMPTLTTALIEVCKVRPEDPIDYLAEYLFKVTTNDGGSQAAP